MSPAAEVKVCTKAAGAGTWDRLGRPPATPTHTHTHTASGRGLQDRGPGPPAGGAMSNSKFLRAKSFFFHIMTPIAKALF